MFEKMFGGGPKDEGENELPVSDEELAAIDSDIDEESGKKDGLLEVGADDFLQGESDEDIVGGLKKAA